MAETPVAFDMASAKRIAEAVRRDKRRPRNNVNQWRSRKIVQPGSKDIIWARTPPGSLILVTPVLSCMIAGIPSDDEYGSEGFNYLDVGGFWTYCAGIFPDSWYPVHKGSSYFLTGGAWFLKGEATSSCDRGDYFSMDVSSAGSGLSIDAVHSPAGPIQTGSLVYVGWKGGEGEYTAILADCPS